MAKPRVVLNGNPGSSFVREDIRTLSQHFEVIPFQYKGKGDLLPLMRTIKASDLCLSWFVDTHAGMAQFACRFAGRPHIAIVGGYEVASDSPLDYGLNSDRGAGVSLRRILRSHVLAKASAIVVPSNFSCQEVLRLGEPKRLEIVPLGVDTEKFKPLAKTASVGTIGQVFSPDRDIKGIGTLMAAATTLGEVDFHVAGPILDDSLVQSAPPNVKFHGELAHDEIATFLGHLRVYCQLSQRESFGLAAVEALAAGCVPVVSDGGALPEVIGDVGFRVPHGDARSVAVAIRRALSLSSPYNEARNRAQERYRIEIRAAHLTELLNSFLDV